MLALQRLAGNQAVQRYTKVRSGDNKYPSQWTKIAKGKQALVNQNLFVRQEEQAGSFFDMSGDGPAPFLVHSSNASLHVSDNTDMAVESKGEAKTFFATTSVVEKANANLQGKVRLAQTNRFLQIKNKLSTKKLFEVEPLVTTKDNSGGTVATQGMAVTTPQLCNNMAEWATGKISLSIDATNQSHILIAEALKKVTGVNWPQSRIDNYHFKTPEQRDNYGRFLDTMVTEFQRVSADTTLGPKLEKALRAKALNTSLAPSLGSAIVTIGIATGAQEAHAKQQGLDLFSYHFASVVAKSGADYVTIENYARRDPAVTDTAGAGDPLFFFRMYGNEKAGQSWHEKQVASGNFLGVTVSFQVS